MSLKADPNCKHQWHFMGPAICPGCKGTAVKKALAGVTDPKDIARIEEAA